MGSDSNVVIVGARQNTVGANQIHIGNGSSTCFRANVQSLTALSDCRDKADVTDYPVGLTFINGLRPITYRWDQREYYWEEDEDGNLIENYDLVPDGTHKKPKLYVGLLAQEVIPLEKAEGYDPDDEEEHIVVGGNPLKRDMSYGNLIMPLINSTQELDDKIIALTARVATLEG